MKPITFTDRNGSFSIHNPENVSALYFPLASEAGLKSAITPNLGGDAKLDQESFLLEPTSVENLHNNKNNRNFWCVVNNTQIYSAAGTSAEQELDKFTDQQEDSRVDAGLMWHTLTRTSKKLGLTSTVTSFIPNSDTDKENVEIMYVTLKNESDAPIELTSYAAVPIYGRSADNLRDHRHVTSLLHRIELTGNGVLVCPTMSFDERGHRTNKRIYYVIGTTGEGNAPENFFPTVELFAGEGGSLSHPRAVYEKRAGIPADADPLTITGIQGKEAMGAMAFAPVTLAPNETTSYILLLGITDDKSCIETVASSYRTADQVLHALEATRVFWKKQVNVDFLTGDADFDCLMKWVSFQPFLRRLFGCSFLPHHDYGRGGRGWRDLWQDCLSLLLMDPANVGKMIEQNYGGVRIDGTNATIIGDGDGNFIADRNGIARVWMDHALWPLMTTKLYIDQTGDIDILYQEVPYFKDAQTMRGTQIDTNWNDAYGNRQRTADYTIYNGSILEHLLIQQLTAFYEVGDHNIYRLRGADWNDALDMASKNGESVAFTCAYAGNLSDLAELILLLDRTGESSTVELLDEIAILLDDDEALFDHIEKKQAILRAYTEKCRHNISGRRSSFSLKTIAANLLQKANRLREHVREQEWIPAKNGEGWFNSYYDDHGNAVEGFFDDHVRMMLTGQVFAIMGDVATKEQIRAIVKSADHYLYCKEIGGYRLNTDFHELKFDMGRMFGFAYGEKENGAVFSHMTVMFANALYRRGFAKEGWKALKTLADTALDFETSCIYPGIPEYFRADGRGMYHYLTGAASWYLLTMITEVFGVRGAAGDLIICPKLLAEQFDAEHMASVRVSFAGKQFQVTYCNPNKKDFGSYTVAAADCDGVALSIVEDSHAVLSRELLDSLSDEVHRITVELS